ncbi:unnamed protein product, partial [Discosporangium mesarthrocarpum]
MEYDWKVNQRVMMSWEDDPGSGGAGAGVGAEGGGSSSSSRRHALKPFYGRVAAVGCVGEQEEPWLNSPWECLVIEWDNDTDLSRLGPWEPRPVDWDENNAPPPEELRWEGRDCRPSIPPPLREQLSQVVEGAMGDPVAEPFLERVTLEDYSKVVPVPMDLGLVKRRLDQNYYCSVDALEFDCNLIYANCTKYNRPRSDIVKAAFSLVDSLVMAIREAAALAGVGGGDLSASG